MYSLAPREIQPGDGEVGAHVLRHVCLQGSAVALVHVRYPLQRVHLHINTQNEAQGGQAEHAGRRDSPSNQRRVLLVNANFGPFQAGCGFSSSVYNTIDTNIYKWVVSDTNDVTTVHIVCV